MLQSDIISQLDLSGTSYTQPEDASRAVIPGTFEQTEWSVDMKDFSPCVSVLLFPHEFQLKKYSAGGIYSTTSDISSLGRSILSSTILSPAPTRRWLRPVSHTANLQFSVGTPWEIFRLTLDTPSKVFDLYTKNGGVGCYFSELVLSPDYGVGYTILEADGNTNIRGVAGRLIMGWINELLFPALEEAAREEADLNYVGDYVSTDQNLNSSMRFAVTSDLPGLSITSLIRNGTDIFAVLGSQILGIPASNVSIRLYPTNLHNSIRAGSEVEWHAIWEDKEAPTMEEQFGCGGWSKVDGLLYGNIGLDDFVFVVGNDGRATSVEARALRAPLERVPRSQDRMGHEEAEVVLAE